MLGLILCGGESSRMGRDKGLIESQNKTWVQLATAKLEELGIAVAISISEKQKENYEKLLPGKTVIVDDSKIALKGPVAAILSVHLQYPGKDLFVLACDLPLMETSVLDVLYNSYLNNSHFQAFVYANNGEPEPLCGIYTAKGLELILRKQQTKKLEKHSMKFSLDQLLIHKISIPENKKHCFRNFNSPEDVFLF
jgi:molybdopterin-guanine dinucleotide biosynthesis protein A